MKRVLAAALLVSLPACNRVSPVPAARRDSGTAAGDGGAGSAAGGAAAGAAAAVDGGTPVKVAPVVRATLTLTVSGPGHTDALEQQKVRAPFKAILRQLRVQDGDHVRDGQVLAVLASQESEAALIGARAMLRAAHTPQQRDDARRALQLARRGVVEAVLRAPEAGVVLSHGADEGALVAEAQDIVSLAATDSFVFLASIVQTDLPRIHRGEPARVLLAARPGVLDGKVHGVLAAASAADLAAPVRIDLAPASVPKALGLFGTAVISVGERRDVLVVPQAAVLRDDIDGVQRLALVADGKAHWERVTPGASAGGRVEIAAPPLRPGALVIVDGQVGLPEGAKVLVAP